MSKMTLVVRLTLRSTGPPVDTSRKPLVQKLLCLIQLLQAHHRLGRADIAVRLQAGRRDLDELSTEGDDLEEKMQVSPFAEKPPGTSRQLHIPKRVSRQPRTQSESAGDVRSLTLSSQSSGCKPRRLRVARSISPLASAT
jgi:hypothetical protein